MSLSSAQLDAFLVAAQALNFSRAARQVHITQSALTQRIAHLESELSLTLFLRKPRGVELTSAGRRLLRYCQAKDALEREVLAELSGAGVAGLGGALRVAAFSTVTRSVLLPALQPLLSDNPGVLLDLDSVEIRDLPRLLNTGAVDIIITTTPLSQADVETHQLGHEENVMVESAERPTPHDVFFDHDPEDPTTADFFRLQAGPMPQFRRSFLDEIYAILDGVALGLGRAIVPRHLAERDPRISVIEGYQSLLVPVVLQYFQQPLYTALQRAAVEQLVERCPAILSGYARDGVCD